ncbi:MAG: DUF4405 domain-containing protein [Chlorobiaceae bacterium]|nr:DUF4405 domain-containing protein [Chlorobiaceae bacterium]
MNKDSFSWRKFTSFGLFLSFLMILLSGVILYIFPGSRGSGFVWEMGGLTKPAWQHQHIIFGFAFSLFSLCHLFLINWKAFFSYLKTKTASGVKRPTEMAIIALLSLFTVVGTLFGIQPFSGIIELGKGISKSWDADAKPEVAAPERGGLSLAELSNQPEITSRRSDDDEGFGYHRRHRHGYDDTSSLSSTRELTNLQEEVTNDNQRVPDTITENRASQMNSSQAPDDELHRRTTKSCSACH